MTKISSVLYKYSNLPSPFFFPLPFSSLSLFLPSPFFFPLPFSSLSLFLPSPFFFPLPFSSLSLFLPSPFFFPLPFSSLSPSLHTMPPPQFCAPITTILCPHHHHRGLLQYENEDEQKHAHTSRKLNNGLRHEHARLDYVKKKKSR